VWFSAVLNLTTQRPVLIFDEDYSFPLSDTLKKFM